MKEKILKNIIFRHAIVSLLVMFCSIFIIVYNVAITIIYDINESRYENEVQMTARYLDLLFERKSEDFLKIIKSDNSIDLRISEISSDRAVLRAGFLKICNKDFSVPVRYFPAFPESFPARLNEPFYFSIAPILDLYNSAIYNEITVLYPIDNGLYVIVFFDRNYINGLLSTLKNTGATFEKSLLCDFSKNYVDLENPFYTSRYDRTFRYALKNDFFLEIHTDYTGINDYIFKLKISIVIVFFIFGIWMIIQHAILRKRVFSPINRMKELITFISRGRFDIKLHDDSYQEIEELSDKLDMMIEKISELTKEVYVKEMMNIQATIKTLQAQVNPHFLLNTLNSLKLMAISQRNQEIIKSVDMLGVLLRYGLYDQNKSIAVSEELDVIRNYVAINQMRFKKNILLSIDCPAKLQDHQMLKLLLQPAVENAIKYGFRSDGALEIKISVRSDRLQTTFVIADNGNGIEEGKLKYIQGCLGVETTVDFSSNLGLMNVNSRIKLKYGKMYGLSIDSKVGEGTVITIRIPDLLCDY